MSEVKVGLPSWGQVPFVNPTTGKLNQEGITFLQNLWKRTGGGEDLIFGILGGGASISAWDDLRFPATAVNPPGLGSDPGFDTTNGGWLFAAGSTELIFLFAQLPHAWNEGSSLKPHVHWQKTTSAAGNVLWQFDYKWAPIGEVMDAAFTTLQASSTVAGTPDNDTADEHLISAFADVSATGRELSDMLVMKLSRIGGDAADTYGADCRLLEFDIHIEMNSIGSSEVFDKP